MKGLVFHRMNTIKFFSGSIAVSYTHLATLGTDPRGNLTRIDNALAQMTQRLEAAKAQLDNLYQQQAAAKEEVGKPFLYEEELRSKNARLVELDTLLNIDGKGQAHTESVVTKSTRTSVLDNLKRPVQPRSTDTVSYTHLDVYKRQHQKSAIAHVLYGGNTLLAHEVGAGKSATRS